MPAGSESLSYSTFQPANGIATKGGMLPGCSLLWAVRLLTCVSATAEGYDLGVMSGVLVLLKAEFALSQIWLSLLMGMFGFSCALGALLGGPIADTFGRKAGLLAMYCTLIIGIATMVFAPHAVILVIGRCIQGMSVGAMFCVVGSYLSELAPERTRGFFVSLEAIFMNVGIFLGMASNYCLLDVTGSHATDWRLMMGLGAVLPCCCLLALLFPYFPESPRWLHLQGRTEEAVVILQRTLCSEEAARVEAQWRQGSKEPVATWGEALCPSEPADRRNLRQGVGVGMVQMLTGITVLIYYADYILTHDLGHRDAFLGMLGVAAAKLLVLILAVFFLDYFGRRPMLLLSSGSMAIALASLGMCYVFDASPWTKVLVLGCCIACFSLGLGGATYVLIVEIFANRFRAKGAALSFCASRCINGLMTLTFPFLSGMISMGGAFLVYSGITCLGCLFIFLYVDETAGLSLEDLAEKRTQYHKV